MHFAGKSQYMLYVAHRGITPFFTTRMVSVSPASYNKPTIAPEEKKTENPMDMLQGGKNHKVDNLEKRFLVWTGKYKSIDEVPPTVPQETMERTRNKMRIRIANIMIVATAIACVGFIYSGKNAAKRGESVQKMNLEWHKSYNEQNPTSK